MWFRLLFRRSEPESSQALHHRDDVCVPWLARATSVAQLLSDRLRVPCVPVRGFGAGLAVGRHPFVRVCGHL